VQRHAPTTLLALFAFVAPVVPIAAFLPNGVALAQTAQVDKLPSVEVYKNPSCGCCGAWVTHMQKAGFAVTVREVTDLSPLRERLGIPAEHASCHSAKVGGYVLEGHVPADDVKRLLREKPQALGLAVPAMPLGAPGMEVPPEQAQSYATLLLKRNAPAQIYVRHAAGNP
jgi:hypothetical protein